MFYRFHDDFDRQFSALDQLRRHVDRAFQEADGQRAVSDGQGALRDLGDKLVVRVDLPGVADSDVKLEVHNDVLSLKAERKGDAPEGFGVQRRERGGTKLARTFALPCAVDVERTTAALTNGVLTLTLPKAESAKPRTIAVKAG
ncbi:MAG TPA: Hsp20/alpha crystallin family protein [Byssovorax sp.]|jgi:HSP20 family protein